MTCFLGLLQASACARLRSNLSDCSRSETTSLRRAPSSLVSRQSRQHGSQPGRISSVLMKVGRASAGPWVVGIAWVAGIAEAGGAELQSVTRFRRTSRSALER
jgi:hypothetical protein